jgi:hypothetical protein
VSAFGAALATIVLGAIAGLVIDGIVGEALAIGLASIGAIAVVSLVFLEVGLGEDRERARERAHRERGAPGPPSRPPPRPRRPD